MNPFEAALQEAKALFASGEREEAFGELLDSLVEALEDPAAKGRADASEGLLALANESQDDPYVDYIVESAREHAERLGVEGEHPPSRLREAAEGLNARSEFERLATQAKFKYYDALDLPAEQRRAQWSDALDLFEKAQSIKRLSKKQSRLVATLKRTLGRTP